MQTSLMVLAIALFAVSHAAGGKVQIVDGDTIEVDGIARRIHGIDAPEFGQQCSSVGGGNWDCGKAALKEMEALVLPANQLACDDRGTDGYGRIISFCRADEVDIADVLVRRGLAWSFKKYSHDYDDAEAEARDAGRGIWQASTETAWISERGVGAMRVIKRQTGAVRSREASTPRVSAFITRPGRPGTPKPK